MITRGIVASIPIVASHYTDMQMQLSFLILMLMQFPGCKATVDEELHSQQHDVNQSLFCLIAKVEMVLH